MRLLHSGPATGVWKVRVGSLPRAASPARCSVAGRRREQCRSRREERPPNWSLAGGYMLARLKAARALAPPHHFRLEPRKPERHREQRGQHLTMEATTEPTMEVPHSPTPFPTWWQVARRRVPLDPQDASCLPLPAHRESGLQGAAPAGEAGEELDRVES